MNSATSGSPILVMTDQSMMSSPKLARGASAARERQS
jgi:hypothetical protein